MAKKNIRSEFVKKLMQDKSNLETVLSESTKTAIKDVIGDSINNGIRAILSEASNTLKEEEVEPTTTPEITASETDVTKNETEANEDEIEVIDTATEDNKEGEEVNDEFEKADEEDMDMESGEDIEAEDDIWARLESFKGENGEYDLTSQDKDTIIDVIKNMDEDDEVRIVKNDDGTYELDTDGKKATFDDETLEDETENEEDETENDGIEFEIETDDSEEIYEDDNLGYKPVMPNNKPGNAKAESEPYEDEPKGLVYEIEFEDDEEDETFVETEPATNEGIPGGARVHKTRTNGNDSEAWRVRNPRNHVGRNESMERKMNAIIAENKELKSIAKAIKEKLAENVIVNASLGRIIKLIVENTTTRDEKVEIVKRFNKVRSLNECKDLYETISGELKKSHKINENANIGPKVEAEAPKTGQNVNETRLDESREVSAIRDLMNRIEKL